MAFVGLKIPHETARLLSELEVPGKRSDVAESHITMIYLGKEVPIDVIAQAMKVTYGVTTATAPFSVRTSLVTCFPKGDDGVPVICRVESEPLHFLHGRLKTALQLHGVPFNDKWPDFKPHVTLSYADAPMADQVIPSVEWGAHELVLWGGDNGDRRLIITFPFSITISASAIARRVAQRFGSLA